MPPHMQAPQAMPAGSRCVPYGALFTLFVGELLALKWAGARLKRARQHKRLTWEKNIRHVLKRRTQPCQDYMHAISNLNQVLPIVDIGLWCFLRLTKRRDAARFWGVALGGAAILRRFAKAWVHRQRPAVWDRVRPRHTSSFPSGHATDTSTLFLVLLCLAWSTAWRSVVILIGTPTILLVGLSRIALGKHYTTDILAGWLTAGVWVLGVWRTLRRQRED
jgi:hypothetical protein